MGIRLHFWGADQTVTGSSHHIETAGQNVLLDCGLFHQFPFVSRERLRLAALEGPAVHGL